jgi:hypothetical protein
MNLLDLLPSEQSLTPRQKFEAFHTRNPQVYRELETMSAQLVARGRKRIGLKMLTEVLRWEHQMRTDDPNSHFKINNSYTSYYARLLIENHPDWEGLFEMRERC